MPATESNLGYEKLALLLQANGYEVVARLPCDLALLDINLPGENDKHGILAARRAVVRE